MKNLNCKQEQWWSVIWLTTTLQICKWQPTDHHLAGWSAVKSQLQCHLTGLKAAKSPKHNLTWTNGHWSLLVRNSCRISTASQGPTDHHFSVWNFLISQSQVREQQQVCHLNGQNAAKTLIKVSDQSSIISLVGKMQNFKCKSKTVVMEQYPAGVKCCKNLDGKRSYCRLKCCRILNTRKRAATEGQLAG